MVFYPPSWLSAGPPLDPSVAVGTVGDFVLRGAVDNPLAAEQADAPVLVSANKGKTKSPQQLADDVELLATGLAHDLQWSPSDKGGNRVIAILSENTIDYLTCCWAIHRIGGTVLLLHGSTAPAENAKHLQNSDCNILIVSPALLGSACAAIGEGSNARLYLSEQVSGDTAAPGNDGIKTVEELLQLGKTLGLGSLAALVPSAEDEAQKTGSAVAYLCPTSGTSGLQKLARLTHRSIIANVLQLVAWEKSTRGGAVEVVLGVTPLSHVQGIGASHTSVYVRDRFILHAKFDMKEALASIQIHRINRLYLVPSVLAALIGNPFLFKAFDLSSVNSAYIGAGTVSGELHAKAKAAQPGWNLVTGYGLTESPAAVAMSSPHEYLPGSVGILLPWYQARLVREDGSEVEAYDEAGELLLSSPNQAAGYLDETTSTTAVTFGDGGWLHTGDVAMFRQSARGDSHLVIVDRLKDMIKVKGMQVSPIAIEDVLRQHPGVADVAVIGVPDDLAGERPRAFVVPAKLPKAGDSEETDALFDEWDEHVQSRLTEPHWIRGRYELLEVLPRNMSGKVTKGILQARA